MSNKQEYRDALAKEFLEALKQSEIEYYCPWYSFTAQRNGFTDRKYNGLNSLYLNLVAYKNNWIDSRWFTFTQLKKLNESRKPEEAYSVKGQHGMPVEFFTVYDILEKKKISLIEYYKILRNASDEQLKDIQRRYRVHNEYTTVFNAHQIQNMELIQKDKMNLKDIDSKNIEDLAKSIKVDLKHESIDRAFYNKKEDAIHLPFAGYFKSQNDYNYTALHELSHSTSHESRLSRNLTGTFGTEQYAIEELIAEMSCSFYGFNLDKNSDPKILNNHKAYIQSWAKVIENDPKKFFDAVSQAQKAADFLEEHSDFLKEKEIFAYQIFYCYKDVKTIDGKRTVIDVEKPVTQFILDYDEACRINTEKNYIIAHSNCDPSFCKIKKINLFEHYNLTKKEPLDLKALKKEAAEYNKNHSSINKKEKGIYEEI